MINEDLLIKKAIEEIENKTLGITKQFLEVHEIAYTDGRPTIAGIDNKRADGEVAVYFSVKGERFYFAVYLNTQPEIAIRWVYVEPKSSVYFVAFSNGMSYGELGQLTKLQPTGGWSIGDLQQPGGNIPRKNSKIMFEPNAGPGDFEDKLTKLLDVLERDKEGVQQLVEQAGGYVQVAIEFHDGNGMFGGPHIDIDCIKRMAALNIEIDFDLYATGNGFKE